MPYQYVREPLTAEESDRLSNAFETPTERLVVWTLLDTGFRVGELCGLTPKNVLWQQRQLRFKGGPHGKKILGHDSLQTTAIYLNFTDVHIQDEFERKW